MVLFMNPFARCERLGPCRSKWERHFNQHVMLKLLIKFSKDSQVNWLGSYWFWIIVWNIFSLLWCRIIHTCWLKRESLWNIWLADDCCTAAVINNFLKWLYWNSFSASVTCCQSSSGANRLIIVFHFTEMTFFKTYLAIESGHEAYWSIGSYLCKLMCHSCLRELISNH